MDDSSYGIGEGPVARVSVSLPEGTTAAIRERVGKREFSAFVAAAVERELRGQILDDSYRQDSAEPADVRSAHLTGG